MFLTRTGRAVTDMQVFIEHYCTVKLNVTSVVSCMHCNIHYKYTVLINRAILSKKVEYYIVIVISLKQAFATRHMTLVIYSWYHSRTAHTTY